MVRRQPSAAQRRELRQAAKRLHPDRGGDQRTYLAAIARINARYATAPHRPRNAMARHRFARSTAALRSRLGARLAIWPRLRHRKRYIQL